MAAGSGVSIYPHRRGFRVFFRYEPAGKLHAKAGFPSVEEAERWADEMRGKIKKQRRTVGDTLNDFAAEVEARAARGEMTATTAREEIRKTRRLLGEEVEGLALASLTASRCEELYRALVASGAATNTHREMLKSAKRWGLWVVGKGWMKVSPWAAVKALGARSDLRDQSLRVDEARLLREAAITAARNGDEGGLAVLIILLCSLRANEVKQIAARDVDDGAGLLWIAGRRLKNANSRRSIAVADEELRELLSAKASGKASKDRIFTFIDKNFCAKSARRLCGVAKVPLVDARGLRRTFATIAAQQGSSLSSVALAMGHGHDAAARTAQRHYLRGGAVESGAARRVLGVLDGGKAKLGKPAAK